MICYLVYPSIQLVIWNPKIVFRYDKQTWSGLPFVATIPKIVHLLRVRRSAPGSTPGAPSAAPVASAAAAPGGGHRGGRRAGSGRDGGILPQGRGARGCVERPHTRGRADPVESAAVTPRICSRISQTGNRPSHLRRSRGPHNGRRAGLRSPLPTRVSASASSVRRQRRARSPPPSASAPSPSSTHALKRRRRASVRASCQRHQVLIVTL